MIRRTVTMVMVLSALGACAALASARPASALPHRGLVTDTVSRYISSSGRYLVIVSVRARQHNQRVTVYLAGAAKRTVRASSHAATALRYALTLKRAPSKLVARAVSPKPGVELGMTLDPAGTGSSDASPTTPTAGTTPAAPSSGGGSANQYPNPYTNLVWSDSFAGPAGSAPSSSNWNIEGGSGQCGDAINTNTSSAANVELNGNDQLAITAQHSGSSYTSAEIETNPITSFPYGAVEADIKLPPGQGLCPAFWMEGDSTSASPCSWPGCGEIDLLEAPSIGADPDDAFFTLHSPWTQTDPSGNYQSFETDTTALGDLSAGFHTYGIIWSPGSIVWTIDGVAYAQATPSSLVPSGEWVFDADRPYSIILDLAVGGWPCDNSPPGSCPGASFPAQMLVNWVRVYK